MKFRRNFANRTDINVVFPEPFLITPSVLVESWENGEPIQHWIDEPRDFAGIGMYCYGI